MSAETVPELGRATWSGSDPAADEPAPRADRLRWILAAVGILGVLLPLLTVRTALSGFNDVRASHEASKRAAHAQALQQDADMQHDMIYTAVFEAAAAARLTSFDHESVIRGELAGYRRALSSDLDRLVRIDLPPALTKRAEQQRQQLETYGRQGAEVVPLLFADAPGANRKLLAFDDSFDALETRLGSLTDALAAEGDRATANAQRQELRAKRWTSAVSAAVIAVMLALALFLYRLGRSNGRLWDRLRHSREALSSRSAQLEAAQSVAHVGSWEWRPDTGEITWSHELFAILGLPPEPTAPPGPVFERRIHPDDLATVQSDRLAVLAGLPESVTDYRIVRPDGTVRDVQGRSARMLNKAGELDRLIGTIQDVTEHRAVERMKDEFVSVISHELRTPLTSLRGALGLLAGGQLGDLDTKAQRMVDIAASSSERLVRLVNDILDVDKMAAGKLHLDRASHEVAGLLETATREMQAMAEGAYVRLVTTGRGPAVVDADGDRAVQTLTNLISNAIKFSPPGGIVEVGAVREGDEVRFTVADQGRGVPPGQEDAVFDRFQQVDASDSREKAGTGLGLAISRGIVEQHGGRIWVTSPAGGGAAFHFTLPVGVEPEALAGFDGETPEGAVLVCDDDPAMVEVLVAVLTEHGYPTLAAGDGRTALELARRHAPSLILLDLLMPGMPGWEVLDELASDPRTADIPVVVLSALTPAEAPALLVSDWITKPAEASTVLGALHRTLGEGPPRVVVIAADTELGASVASMFERNGANTTLVREVDDVEAALAEPLDLLVVDLDGDNPLERSVLDRIRSDPGLRPVPLAVYGAADGASPTEPGAPGWEGRIGPLLERLRAPR